MRKAVLHARVWLFSAAQAIKPIRNVRQILVRNLHRRQSLVAGQQNIPALALLLNAAVLLVIAELFHNLPARTPFSARIVERRTLPHDARVSGSIISETRRVAHQKTLWISQ